MRQIKFRGKNLYKEIVRQEDGVDFTEINEGCMWLYGGYAEIDGQGYLFPEAKCHQSNGDYWMDDDAPDIPIVDPNTVGQYTVLHDRKDREIYEGDILFVEFADKSGGYYLVGWNEETASWGIMDRYEYQFLKEGNDCPEFMNHTLLAFLKQAIVCEVVGNIHDNPELMNVPNKE